MKTKRDINSETCAKVGLNNGGKVVIIYNSARVARMEVRASGRFSRELAGCTLIYIEREGKNAGH